MTNQDQLSEFLVALGVPKPEADVYVQLVILAAAGPATGYQVAKAMGKDPTSVYRALEELRKKGCVETVAGRGKQFRPEDPQALLARLEGQISLQAGRARTAFGRLPRTADAGEVYRLATLQQTTRRCQQLLGETRQVALLELVPETFRIVRSELQAAVRRGVAAVIKFHRLPADEERRFLQGATLVAEPDGETSAGLMPGLILHGVFDCRAHLVTYLDPVRQGDDAQAFWTANRLLAYQAHNGLASEITQTAVREGLARGEDAAALAKRIEDLAAAMHGPVDWDEFWNAIGYGDAAARRDVRERAQVPWSAAWRRRHGGEAPGRARDDDD